MENKPGVYKHQVVPELEYINWYKLKWPNTQHSGHMGQNIQNIQNWKKL